MVLDSFPSDSDNIRGHVVAAWATAMQTMYLININDGRSGTL